MRRISILALGISAFCFLSPGVFGGPEALPSGKEMKQVAPAPAPEACNWTGFYFGVHGGGQWGHSEDRDLDFFSTRPATSLVTTNLERLLAVSSATTGNGNGWC